MGRRKNRKRERRQEQRSPDALAWSTGVPAVAPPFVPPEEEEYDYLFQSFGRGQRPGVKVCGGCREFIEDAEGGRGTCLHPGSGILSPWTDTPGCDFHARRR